MIKRAARLGGPFFGGVNADAPVRKFCPFRMHKAGRSRLSLRLL
jgi:hypothetical protein